MCSCFTRLVSITMISKVHICLILISSSFYVEKRNHFSPYLAKWGFLDHVDCCWTGMITGFNIISSGFFSVTGSTIGFSMTGSLTVSTIGSTTVFYSAITGDSFYNICSTSFYYWDNYSEICSSLVFLAYLPCYRFSFNISVRFYFITGSTIF